MDAPAPDEMLIYEAWKRGDFEAAATLALEQYGQEILGYLFAAAPCETTAEEAFSNFAERQWRGFANFAWRSSCRTWLYVVARNSLRSVMSSESTRAGRLVRFSTAGRLQLAMEKTLTRATYERTTFQTKLDEIRGQLDPESRELLVLRVDRQLSWPEIARIMSPEPLAEDDETQLNRVAATLRKRFARLKDKLRQEFAALKRSGPTA